MKEKGKVLFCLLFFLILIQFASAIDTFINIKTLPDHEVQLTIYDSKTSSFSVLENGYFKAISDEYGDVSFVFSSDVEEFNIIIYIKKDGEKRMPPEKILNHQAGEALDLRLAPDWFDFIETPNNETNNETIGENLTEEVVSKEVVEESSEILEDFEQDKGATITGKAIFGKEGFFSSKIFYYLLGVFALLIIIFVTARLTKYKLTKPKKIRITKMSEMKDQKREKINNYKEIIEDAEKKIKEAQEEIKKLKDKNNAEDLKKKKQEKIESVKKKIESYEKELLKLREEDND